MFSVPAGIWNLEKDGIGICYKNEMQYVKLIYKTANAGRCSESQINEIS